MRKATVTGDGSRKLKKGGGAILERGDRKTAFEHSSQCFSHNYFK